MGRVTSLQSISSDSQPPVLIRHTLRHPNEKYFRRGRLFANVVGIMQRLLCYLLVFMVMSSAMAETYRLKDGRSLTGEPIGITARGLVVKLGDGSYSALTPWDQFTQETLKLLRDHPKAGEFAEPLIELTEEEREKLSGLTLVDVPRLDRPSGQTGIVGMLFATGVGWFLVLLVYLGNLFAAYEVAMYRAYSPQIVCGIAAVFPWIGPIVMFSIPRNVLVGDSSAPPPAVAVEEEFEPTEPEYLPESAQEILPPGEMFDEAPVPEEATPALLPETITYSRGVVTFNRRFFETKLTKFTKLQKPDDIADLVLLFKTSRGEHQSTYISKLEQTSMTIQVAKGNATEDVTVPYLEVYEVQIKHKDLL